MTVITAFKGAVLVAGVAAFLGAALAKPADAAEMGATDEPIKLALNEWTGQHISTTVAGELLKRMGYNVEYVTAGYYPQMIALTTGELSATLEIWSSNIGESYDEALATGNIEDIGDLGLVPVETWYYPDYVGELCPGLPSYTALNDCAEMFATPDTMPKGRFVDYPLDWGTSNVDRIKALGLNFASQPAGSEGAAIAEIQSAFERKAPLVLMFWEPHWLHSVYKLNKVELPPYEEGCYDDPAVGINPDATYDCDWLRGHIMKTAWKGMAEKWPAAYELLKNYTLTNDDQNPMMKAIDQDGRDMIEVVNEWIDANQSRWQPWIDAATKG